MAEQGLDDADVGAELEQVGGEAVPQHVRGDALVQLAAPRRLAQRVAHRLVRDDRALLATREQLRSSGSLRPPVDAQRGQHGGAEHHVPITPELAIADVDEVALAVDVLDPQRADLIDPQTGAVRRQDDRALLDRADRVEQRLDLGAAEDRRQLLGYLRPGDRDGDLRTPERGGVEELDRRHVLVLRRLRDLSLLGEVEQKRAHLVETHLLRRLAVVGYEGPCAAEVIVACRRLVSPQLQVFGHSIAELSHRCPPGERGARAGASRTAGWAGNEAAGGESCAAPGAFFRSEYRQKSRCGSNDRRDNRSEDKDPSRGRKPRLGIRNA
ncbi:hypothetical protein WME73_35765 [Sorangium sp. So ce302]